MSLEHLPNDQMTVSMFSDNRLAVSSKAVAIALEHCELAFYAVAFVHRSRKLGQPQ
jgi:hypothetical protein